MFKFLRKTITQACSHLWDSHKLHQKEKKHLHHIQKTEVAKARTLARNTSKALHKYNKYEKRHHKKLAHMHFSHKNRLEKAMLKDQEKARKHEIKLAKQHVERIKAGRLLNPARISRYITVIKLLAPLLGPVIYRLSIMAKNKFDAYQQAEREGVIAPSAITGVTSFSKAGTHLNLRITKATQSLDIISRNKPGNLEVKQFVSSTRNKLTDLATAVANAETFPKIRKKEAQASIDHQLEAIENTIQIELGVLR